MEHSIFESEFSAFYETTDNVKHTKEIEIPKQNRASIMLEQTKHKNQLKEINRLTKLIYSTDITDSDLLIQFIKIYQNMVFLPHSKFAITFTVGLERKFLVEKGTHLYRIVKNPNFTWNPPLQKITKHGRLNKPNESFLYLSFSEETAFAELKRTLPSKYYLNIYSLKKELPVTLSDANVHCSQNKSLINIDRLIFKQLSSWHNKLMGLPTTGNEWIDHRIYLITNFLRNNVLEFPKNNDVMGILYPSVKMNNSNEPTYNFRQEKVNKKSNLVITNIERLHEYITIDQQLQRKNN